MLYIYYNIFAWNNYLIHRTIGLNTWWRNLCWQAQRSDICCSFSAGLHRSWEGFWFSLSSSVSKWPPWLNQCPETSTEQKTIKKTCGFCQGPQPAKRMDAVKVAEGGFLRWIFCWITSQPPKILQETYWSPHGSEIHPENSQVWWRKNHGLGLHPVWGCARDLQDGRQHQ